MLPKANVSYETIGHMINLVIVWSKCEDLARIPDAANQSGRVRQ